MNNHSDLQSNDSSQSEEVMIICSLDEMKKQFNKDNLVVWYNPQSHSKKIEGDIKKFENTYGNGKTFNMLQDLTTFLAENSNSCQVIISGINQESIVESISKIKIVRFIHILCDNTKHYEDWSKKYKIVSINDDFEKLLKNIDSCQEIISLTLRFPLYVPIFDDFHRSTYYYQHLYLKGFVNFQNREQAKKDFLSLARVRHNKSENTISQFEKEYTSYDKSKILEWYSKDSFFFQILNNSLRIATTDAILYCRFAIKDLELAIQEDYQQKSKNFQGLVYRGASISDKEWTELQQNVGRDIEVLGFLSTSKNKKIAEKFAKNVLITIIVPGAPYLGDQSFVELEEYSKFAEEEVLFNIRSRFTVLKLEEVEINANKKIHHVVLLYGAEAMKKYMIEYEPKIKMEVEKEHTLTCKLCTSTVGMKKSETFFVSLSCNKIYVCKKCLKDYRENNKEPLLCISERNRLSNCTLEGFQIEFPKELEMQFFGYPSCKSCGVKNYEYCYKCLDCQKSKVIYCNNCVENDCLKNSHLVVLENYPFAFWSEKMSDNELSAIKYQRKLYESMPKKTIQGAVFIDTHNYEKAVQYYDQVYTNLPEDEDDRIKAEVLELRANAYSKMNLHKEALEFSKEVLKLREKAFKGKSHPELAASYINLAMEYSEIGKYQDTINFLFKAMEILKEFPDPWNEERLLNNLGVAYYNLAKYQLSIDYHLKALKIRKNILGDKDPETAASYNQIGLAFCELGKYRLAKEFCLKAVETYKVTLGDKHPETSAGYNNLGLACNGLQEYKESNIYYSKALEIRKQTLGVDHSDIAASFNNLANTHSKLGNYQKSIEYQEKALEIYETALEKNHPDIAVGYNNIGSCYFKLGEFQKAIKYCEKALKIRKEALGNDHPHTAESYTELGNAWFGLQKYKKAESYFLEALKITRKIFGDNHQYTAGIYSNLGAIYTYMDQNEKALEYHEKALKIREAVLEPDHTEIGESYINLGCTCSDLYEAIEFFTKASDIFKKKFPNDHPKMAKIYTGLGATYFEMRDFQKSYDFHSKALKIQKKTLGENHPDTKASYEEIKIASEGIQMQKMMKYYEELYAKKNLKAK